MDDYIYPVLYKPSDSNIRKAAELVQAADAAQEHPERWNTPEGRRDARVQTIYGTLAIQDSELTLEQVRRIVTKSGTVHANGYEIAEAVNTTRAYKLLPKLNPFSLDDMRHFHEVLMRGLDDEPGQFRTTNVQMGMQLEPPFPMVPAHIENLFRWYAESEIDPILKSIVFSIEIPFIHPFCDGNGITGRAWQTRLLGRQHKVLFWAPYEEEILPVLEDYRFAMSFDDTQAFVDIVLDALLRALAGMMSVDNSAAPRPRK